MMTSLLSIFDPCSSTLIKNWMILLFVIFFPLKNRLWLINSITQFIYYTPMNIVSAMMKTPSKSEFVFVSVFMYVLLINFLGLLPFGFSVSSHFSFNFALGLVLWLSTMIWGFTKNFTHNVAHLTPMGCPLVLVPFMVMVETISSLIRPLTLSLRLMANMLAGHLILTLVSKAVFAISMPMNILFFLIELLFTGFELMVAMIQTFVFTNLMMMYWLESEHH